VTDFLARKNPYRPCSGWTGGPSGAFSAGSGRVSGRFEYGLGSLKAGTVWKQWHWPFLGATKKECGSIRAIRTAFSGSARMELNVRDLRFHPIWQFQGA
jgi:hypothetical protein